MSNIRLRLVIYTFVVPQGDLHRQNVPSTFLGVLYDLEDNVLVAKRFLRSPGFSKFARLGNVTLLLCRFAITLLHRDICPLAVVAAI